MMSAPILEILLFAALTVFLGYRLWGVLGTREGFEDSSKGMQPRDLRVDPSPHEDDTAVLPVRRDERVRPSAGEREEREASGHVGVREDDPQRDALQAIREIEPDFDLDSFVDGAKQAYEIIFLAFADGDIGRLQPLLATEILNDFAGAIRERERKGMSVEARFIGIREAAVEDVALDRGTGSAEIRVRFVADLITAVRSREGEIVEGDPKTVARQVEHWTFERCVGASNPNWRLLET